MPMVFHERIVGMHAGIKPLSLVCGDGIADPKGETLGAWTAILKINYWPIRHCRRPGTAALRGPAEVLRRLRTSAQAVNATGVDNSHDLTGRVFQES